jgi:DNA recombination protein RmuC
MSAVYILFVVVILLLVILIVINNRTSRPGSDELLISLKYKLDGLSNEVSRIESVVKSEIVSNRTESAKAARDGREEMSHSFQSFGELISGSSRTTSELQRYQLQTFSNNLNTLTKSLEEKLTHITESNNKNTGEVRRELKDTLETIRATFEKKVTEMQTANEKKLEEMRITVDEKLQTTLETRLGDSFKLISERLEAVHKGLGDMQQLATGVGDLKKVLTNVKTRGVLGEYQLENLLEQLFTTDQYAKNVKTKAGSNALVEFAIKMPGREDQTMWLPIDSKFPKEDFELLLNAYEHGTADQIEECRKSFVKGVKRSAMDICSKYIDPPNTTDFAILFLPFESLYAEVLRTPGLFESVQKECRINIAGPTTLSAFLSSLQMGFRTLAIEKRSSEVWHLLGAIKTQFGHFGAILEKTQKKLQEANNVIDEASKRSRVIERKLQSVQELPPEHSLLLLRETPEGIESEDET